MPFVKPITKCSLERALAGEQASRLAGAASAMLPCGFMSLARTKYQQVSMGYLYRIFSKLGENAALSLPQATISTFNQLPIPVSEAFSPLQGGRPDIRAVVLDKDNCFAKPKENSIYGPYEAKFKALRAAYPPSQLLIVSNSAGSNEDPDGIEAALLELATGVKVLRHSTRKPFCGDQIMEHFRKSPNTKITSPRQVAVVGDRLGTDVMMANMMGSWGIWVKDGVQKSVIGRLESDWSDYMTMMGYFAPKP